MRALDDVSVDFEVGGFTAIMGPSGSGKSTLLHCMAGTELLRLLCPMQIGLVGERSTHVIATMAVDDVHAHRLQRARAGDDMGQHRHACDLLQHFRQDGLHPLAFARGENDDVTLSSFSSRSYFDRSTSSQAPVSLKLRWNRRVTFSSLSPGEPIVPNFDR